MEKLIQELIAKAGLSAESAQKVSGVVLNFLKEKLPAGLSEQADKLLDGNVDLSSIMSSFTKGDGGSEGGLMDKVKDIFGK